MVSATNHSPDAADDTPPTAPGQRDASRTPFDLRDDEAYQRWRDWKLEHGQRVAGDPVIEIDHPARLRRVEYKTLVHRLATTNMAIYRCRGERLSKAALGCFTAQLGLLRPDAHLWADSDHIASLHVRPVAGAGHYIPYTNRPLSWHTDGYYNAPHARIRSFVLHCIRPAMEGGDSTLLDPEIVYLMLRDRNPDHVRALSRNDCMSIPPNVDRGCELRPWRTGPVFSVDDLSGSLHMRYTARKRHIRWRRSAATDAALAALEDILSRSGDWAVCHRLEAGQGVVCNNVLHRRSAFTDAPDTTHGRLLYRARFQDRVRGTGLHDIGLATIRDRAPSDALHTVCR